MLFRSLGVVRGPSLRQCRHQFLVPGDDRGGVCFSERGPCTACSSPKCFRSHRRKLSVGVGAGGGEKTTPNGESHGEDGTFLANPPCLPDYLQKATVGAALVQSVQSLSRVRLFATPWTAACQASLSITNSRSLLKLMSIVFVMPSSHLILCHPFSSCLQSFLESGSFPMSQFFVSGCQIVGLSASSSVLPMNIQD